jgi:radical SAM superfamily enzyme YgiQ (UPF0313 family)
MQIRDFATEGSLFGALAPLHQPGAVLLLSCYELGHAPHGLAVPLGFLRRAGFQPAALDLAIDPLDEEAVRRARVLAISVPMHTSLRLALAILPRLRELAPGAAIGFYGHYAVLHARLLAAEGAAFRFGGEFEDELIGWLSARARQAPPASFPAANAAPGCGRAEPAVALKRLRFPAPARSGVGGPERYARLLTPGRPERLAGYAETTRGCLDTCRHCPIPAVYRGRFFAVDRETVLADIEAQIAAGAEHITFGDPDFLNGPRHGLAIAGELHRRHPEVSFDITAQVSHLLRDHERLPELAALGCAFVTSAVESLSDRVLAALAKRHRRADVDRLLDLCDAADLPLRPTFVPFTPWTTLVDLLELCDYIAERDLVDQVAPVQLSIRLLVPPGSLLLEEPALRAAFGEDRASALGHAWVHPDPRMDALQREIADLVAADTRGGVDPATSFATIHRRVAARAGLETPPPARQLARRKAPRLSEPWFC